MRYYLGVHECVSTPGYMEKWNGKLYDRERDVKLEMIILWNRLIPMEPPRITQNIFNRVQKQK